MAVTRKVKNLDLDNAISNLMDPKPAAIPEPAVFDIKPQTVAKPKEEKIKITFFMNKNTKDKLQEYCTDNDMTLTAGIKKAIREMLNNSEE